MLAACAVGCAAPAPGAPGAPAAPDAVTGITAVAAKTSGDYARKRLPDGTFEPEYYYFGYGGKWGGELADPTMDKLQFAEVARVVAGALATQNYLPTRDAAGTRLLIMLYWGTTQVPGPASDSMAYDHLAAAQDSVSRASAPTSSGPAGKGPAPRSPQAGAESDAALAQMSQALTLLNMENEQRDRLDFRNAHMLGYDSEGLLGTDYGLNMRGTAFGSRREELIAEIEENRYFVVLMAYDFPLMWKHKKHKLVWETRFSLNERHNAFDKALPAMAQYASRYFGQDSRGLLRTEVPEGKVEVGEPKSLGEVEVPQK